MSDAAINIAYDRDYVAGELSRLEADLIAGLCTPLPTVEALIARARDLADDALVGRARCLLSRLQIIAGRHEEALRTAQDGLAAFAALDAASALRCAVVHAETWRAAGAALSKLGRVAEALPKLEEAVRIAEGSCALPATTTTTGAGLMTAQSALLRSLVTLGLALFAIREFDAAIDLYHRAIEIADAHPNLHERFFDDVLLARANLLDSLHERVRRRRAAGDHERATDDVSAARNLLDPRAWRIETDDIAPSSKDAAARPVSTLGRSVYYACLGHHQLITAQPAEALATFKRQLEEIQLQNFTDDWGIADANANIAHALMELGMPRDALAHSTLALAALDRHDESHTRAAVLRVRASAFHAIGESDAAYAALTAHHALRERLEALAAQQYATHMTARLGLERARADADSQRRIAGTLETLGRIGQELTSNLDADAVFHILTRHVGSLLHATAFTIWLLDPSGERLRLLLGIEDGRRVSAADIFVSDSRSLAARAVRERREVFHTGAEADTRLSPLFDGTRPLRTALFSPLIVSNRVLGVISIKSERVDAYNENERSIFRTLSTYAAIALDNAAAYTKLEQTVVELRATQSELAAQTAEFERLSMTDALTGVANRRHLYERAQVEIATMRRKRGQLAVVMFDIDHFKMVNDTYGHGAGDAVLRTIAHVAKEWLRPADLIARLGGEEFALLLPGAGLPEAMAIAERIRSSIAATAIIAGNCSVRVTSSFGVATFDPESETLDPVLSRADAALYAAKQSGRDRVRAG